MVTVLERNQTLTGNKKEIVNSGALKGVSHAHECMAMKRDPSIVLDEMLTDDYIATQNRDTRRYLLKVKKSRGK